MGYNKELQDNNTELQEILAKVNALPNAGGGSEDLDDVLTEQEAKIAQLQAILDTKAAGSGGASLDTCTVILEPDVTIMECDGGFQVFYTTIENGQMVNKCDDVYVPCPRDLENVLCGSLIVIYVSDVQYPKVIKIPAISGEAAYILSKYGVCAIKAPTTPASTSTVTFAVGDPGSND